MAAQKSLKVKINNNDDTRLWRYQSCDYQELCTFITTTWQNDDFIAQYEDDEGDLITIASTQDLKDAFDFAREENKKSLKIFVQNYVKQKREQKKAQQSQQPLESKEDEQASEPKQFGSTKEMVFDFLSNQQIVLLLPEFFGNLIKKLTEKGGNLKVDEITNLINAEIKDDKYKPITSHPLYIKFGALVIPYVANRIGQQQSLYPHFRMDTIKTWINQLIQMLHQVLQQSEKTMGCSFKDIVIDIQYPAMTDTGKVIHFGVECDLCGQYPIIGDRYKSAILSDWDCCSKCEPKHDGPLIKFKQSSKNHANSSFKGLTEIMKRLSPENNVNNNEQKNDDIDDIDIYDDIVVDCICGSKMQCIVAKKAYKRCNTVYCDNCSAQFFNEMVYHCPMGNDARFHKGGFDLCLKCANKQVEAEKAEQQKPEQQEQEQEVIIVDEVKQDQEEPVAVEPSAPAAPEEPEQEQEQQEQVEVAEAPKEEEFLYASQLTTIKQVMALNDNESDEMIKTLLVQNKGDITRVVPMLLQ